MLCLHQPRWGVGSYGKLHKGDWLDTPAFAILGGELKERFGVPAMSVQGPPDHPNDYSDWGKRVLKVVITDKNMFLCSRRKGPAA